MKSLSHVALFGLCAGAVVEHGRLGIGIFGAILLGVAAVLAFLRCLGDD